MALKRTGSQEREGSLDPSDLQSEAVLDMSRDRWQNTEGPADFDDPVRLMDVTPISTRTEA